MPEYLHPGVYIEETSFRGKPIQGVSTSTAGFVGRAQAGPEGRATLVTSFNQFRRTFGEPFGTQTGLGDYLGHAVRAFFENGGSRVYVVRVLAADAASSSIGIGLGTVFRLPANLTVRGPTDRIPLNTLRGVEVGSVLRVFTRPNAAAAFTELASVRVQSYDAPRNSITLDPADALAPGVALTPEHTYFLLNGVAPQTGAVAGPRFLARNRGSAGDQLAVYVRPVDLPPVRLAPRTVLRDRPLLHTLAGVTLAAGATQLELPAAALQRLRTGDIISIGSEDVTITAIADVRVDLTPTVVAGAGLVDYSAGGAAALVDRSGQQPAAPIPLLAPPDLSAAGLAHGVAAVGIALPHDLVAPCLTGDIIRLEQGAGPAESVTLAIGALQFPAGAVNVTFTALTADQANPAIRLRDTSNADPATARVVVADVTSFTAPFRSGSFQPVAISDGGVQEASEVLLVNAATRTLLLRKAAAPAPVGQFSGAVTPASWISLESLQVARDAQTTFDVASTSSFYQGALVELDTGSQKFELTVASVDAGARTVTTSGGVGLGANTYVDVAPAAAQRAAYLRTAEIELQVLQGGVLKESFSGLSWNPAAEQDSSRRYYVDRINDAESGSALVHIETVPPPPAGSSFADQPTTNDGYPLVLGSGSDGSALTAVDVIGTDRGPGRRTGIEALGERDDIAIVAVPGVTDESVQGALLSHCERLRYRIAVLDGRIAQSDVSDIQSHRNNYDSKYGAYYAPWLKTLDLSSGRTILAPPSGYVAGIYARTDTERGVHKAPANEVVRNILDVEFPFTAGEQDVLNPIGVNLIRDLTPRAIRVWGARTLSSDQEWKYVNVRRLFIFLEHSIDLGTQWVVFEPNNEALWSRVRETIVSFLVGVWKTGALLGRTPDEAFFVRCDRTTMTQDDIDNGRLVCEIGVAPTMPAEFVIFRIGQFTASSPS